MFTTLDDINTLLGSDYQTVEVDDTLMLFDSTGFSLGLEDGLVEGTLDVQFSPELRADSDFDSAALEKQALQAIEDELRGLWTEDFCVADDGYFVKYWYPANPDVKFLRYSVAVSRELETPADVVAARDAIETRESATTVCLD